MKKKNVKPKGIKSKSAEAISGRFAVFVAAFSFLGALPTVTLAAVNAETHRVAARSGAAEVGEIGFEKESVLLSGDAKEELKKVVNAAQAKGEIREIKVIAWSDREYPAKGNHLNASEISLAERRAEGVQSYLENTLNLKNVRVVNMAERPSKLQNSFGTTVANTKNDMEKGGAAPAESDKGLFGIKGKASQAVVMVYLN